MAYKERSKLLKSKMEDLTEVELEEMKMYANMEVDSLLARLTSYSKDFKHLVAVMFINRVN